MKIPSFNSLDKAYEQCYFINSYTTDGSGINHMKYDIATPTVWAHCPDQSAFLYSFLMFLLYRYADFR